MTRPADLAADLFTVEEFYRRIPDGQKADLIDGVIYMASPDTRRANTLTRFLTVLFSDYVETKALGGEVFVSRFAFELTETRAPEPDVAYVRPQRLHLVRDRGMQGGPDIAVEIVSRDSRQRDYIEKKQLYQEAGVEEYWIIDPIQDRVEFYRLRGNRYDLVSLEQNRIFRSTVLPGFWLNVEWLLADPPPNAYECLQELLQA